MTTETIVNSGNIWSRAFFTGDAGSINIDGDRLSVSNGGWIFADTWGKGKVGNIDINSKNILVMNKGIISSETSSEKQADNIDANADELLSVEKSQLANNKITIQNQRKYLQLTDMITNLEPSNSSSTGVTIKTPNLLMTNSLITSEAINEWNAANINLYIPNRLVIKNSEISTSAKLGGGGDITIAKEKIANDKYKATKGIWLENSKIFTSADNSKSSEIPKKTSNGNGGDITVESNHLIMKSTAIQANAESGNGGDINISADSFIPEYGKLIAGGKKIDKWPPSLKLNVIQAASEDGLNGKINLTPPQLNISGDMISLNTNLLPPPDISKSCQELLESSLGKASKGNIPLNEKDNAFIPPILTGETSALSLTNTPQTLHQPPCGQSF
jgi:hypothetical protein